MSYTISEAAQKTGLPPSTIRYYDKEGLLPNIKRKNGIRVSVITIRKGCCPTSNGKTASVCLKTWTCG